MKKNGNGKEYPKEVFDYAQELYLSVSPGGGHKYSLRAISEMVKERFNNISIPPDPSTIQRWSTRKSPTGRTWKQLWEEGTVEGILNAQDEIQEINETQVRENGFKENVSKFNEQLYLISMDFILKGYKPFSKKTFEPENKKQAIEMVKLGLEIKKMQEKEVEAIQDRVVTVVFEVADEPPVVELLPQEMENGTNGFSESATNAINGTKDITPKRKAGK